MARKKLGEVLRDRGKISQKDLLEAIEEQAGKAGFLGELLLRRGLVSKQDLVVSLEEVTRTPYVDATTVSVNPTILELVPLKIARRFCVLPVEIEK
jgi:type IV pilus assembly protein PilB